ncbi:hypothetical protein AB0B66_26905 [Catellatospora sp. NPDC049111]|uniref:hypothetical protein n=1 Tax=Catellatospora sp. NPDC049111 TaxID=3155271 RepID=UPI0033FE9170
MSAQVPVRSKPDGLDDLAPLASRFTGAVLVESVSGRGATLVRDGQVTDVAEQGKLLADLITM